MMDCCNYSFYRIIMFILPITVLRKVELYWNNRRKFAQSCFIKMFCKAKLFYNVFCVVHNLYQVASDFERSFQVLGIQS